LKVKYTIFNGILILFCVFVFIMDLKAADTNSQSTNKRISIVDAHAYPNPFDNEKGYTHIKFKIIGESTNISATSTANVSIVIYDYNGKKVWTKRGVMAVNGTDGIEWGGDNDMGKKVANGLYFAKIIVEGVNTRTAVVKILVK